VSGKAINYKIRWNKW